MNRGARALFSVLFLLTFWPRSANAVRLQFAGIAGNSGAAGATIVRGAEARQGGGVAIDKQGRIYTGGGDKIDVLNAAGRQLWQIGLPRPGFVLGFNAFAVSGDYLYFLAGPPVPWEKHYYQSSYTMVEPNLCRTRMLPSAVAELVVPSARFHDYTKMDISLTADIRNGQVYLGYTTLWDPPGRFTVFKLAAAGDLQPIFTVPDCMGGLACDEDGNLYVGGNNQIYKFDAAGKPLPGPWPVKYPSLTVYDADYHSGPMLTPDAIWEMGGYGDLGRYNRDFQPTPGLAAINLLPLKQTMQVLDAGNGNYYFKSPDALYLGTMQNETVKLLRRFGSVPLTNDLALTDQGYIGLGDDYLFLWFDFNSDDPASPPVNGQYDGPAARGYADENGWHTIGTRGVPWEYNPPPDKLGLVTYKPEPLVGNYTATAAASGQFKSRIYEIAKVGHILFAIAGKNCQLMHSSDAAPFDLAPVDLPFSDDIGSICALGDKTLLVAAGKTVSAYRVDDNGDLAAAWTLAEARPGDKLGAEIHIAADGNQLLVADTTRQRVLLFGLQSLDSAPALQAQFGETDVAGTETDHLDTPTLVCLRSGRAVVYDSANQRIVKLRLR